MNEWPGQKQSSGSGSGHGAEVGEWMGEDKRGGTVLGM